MSFKFDPYFRLVIHVTFCFAPLTFKLHSSCIVIFYVTFHGCQPHHNFCSTTRDDWNSSVHSSNLTLESNNSLFGVCEFKQLLLNEEFCKKLGTLILRFLGWEFNPKKEVKREM